MLLDLASAFADLSTPLIADACLREGLPVRAAPAGIAPVLPGTRLAGRCLPSRHYGSVDVFLEALESAEAGDVLVIDNGGRADEACIGDLVVLEARAAGVAGLAVWGLHRDTRDLIEIALPVFSCGAFPSGPLRLEPREAEALAVARFGSEAITRDDHVFADEDGVVFVAGGAVERVLGAARRIFETERAQAERIRGGETLRAQTAFADYLARRAEDPAYSFRQHLRRVGGAIEE